MKAGDAGRTIARIKVIGVGGGGSNAVRRMMHQQYQVRGVEYVVMNTDVKSLELTSSVNSIHHSIQIGSHLTQGFGAGGDAKVGEMAARENMMVLQKVLRGADLVFIAAGMGGIGPATFTTTPRYQDTAYVGTGNAPDCVTLVGAIGTQQQSSGPPLPVSIMDYTIVLAGTGLQPVAFNYAFFGLPVGGYDSAALIYDYGSGLQVVTNLSTSLDGTQRSYFKNATFQGGHTFGFRVYSNNDAIPDRLRICYVPEPSALTLLTLGAGALGWRLRRRAF